MQVLFFRNFQKRQNSTKRPSTGSPDRVLSCQLKENCSIESPVLKLSYGSSGWQDTLNYCYIPEWGRFYKVSDAVYIGGTNWEIHLQDDALASNYAQIIAADAFIEYSGLSGETYVPDQRMTMRGNVTLGSRTTVTLMDDDLPVFDNELTYYVTVVNTDGADTCYQMSGHQFQRLSKGMLEINNSSGTLEQIQMQVGSVFQAITSVIAMPFKLSAHSSAGGTSHAVTICDQTITEGDSGISCIGWIPSSTHPAPYDLMYYNSSSIDIPWDPTINDYRNLSPYTDFALWLPYHGEVSIPADYLVGQSSITLQTVVSVRDGSVTYKVSCNGSVFGVYNSTIGQQISIAQIMGNKIGVLKDALGMATSGVGSVLTGNYMGLAESMTGGLFNMGLHGLERSVSKTGATTGSPMKYLNRDVVLTRLYHQTVTTPANFKATIGAPYMRVDTLGNHAGYYVKTNNASIAVSHYAGEADAINSALNSGVYLE